MEQLGTEEVPGDPADGEGRDGPGEVKGTIRPRTGAEDGPGSKEEDGVVAGVGDGGVGAMEEDRVATKVGDGGAGATEEDAATAVGAGCGGGGVRFGTMEERGGVALWQTLRRSTETV